MHYKSKLYRDLGRPVKDSEMFLKSKKISGLEVKKRRKKTKKKSYNKLYTSPCIGGEWATSPPVPPVPIEKVVGWT